MKFVQSFEKMLDEEKGYYKKNIFLRFQDTTIELGYILFHITSKRKRGYIIHYDLIDEYGELKIRRIGRYNNIVFEESAYEKYKDKVPDDFGIYKCSYTEYKSMNGQVMKVGKIEKKRSGKKSEGILCGHFNVPFEYFENISNREITAEMFNRIQYPEFVCDSTLECSKDIDKAVREVCNFYGKKKIEYEPFCSKLMEHQKAGAKIAQTMKKFAFFFDTGTGKTLMALEIMYRKQIENGIRFLIICPKTIINTAWLEDCEAFFPNMRILPLIKGVNVEYYERIFRQWNSKKIIHDLSVIEYFEHTEKHTVEDSQRMLSRCAEHFITNPEAFRIDPERYTIIDGKNIDGIIFDESSMLKNSKTDLFKQVEMQCTNMKYVYLLSGKPAPNNTYEYLSQMRIVAPRLYFTCKNKLDMRKIQNESLMPNENAGIILNDIKKISFTVSKEDCLDLPETVNIIRNIELPDEAKNIYDNIKQHTWEIVKKIMLDEKGNRHQYIKYVYGSAMKLRQVCNGILNTSEIKNNTQYIEIHDSKLNELVNIVHGLGGAQAIIWCQFRYDIKRIEEALKSRGFSVTTAYAETENIDKSITSFKEGKVQFLIAHPKTLQYGVTLTNCSYAIYYSISYSFEEYYQSHDRIYRKGQNKSCTYIFLLAKNTIDEEIHKIVLNKLDKTKRDELLLHHFQS